MKRKIKIGNDGYGGKNITVTKTKTHINIIVTDPHDWGRISSGVSIPSKDLNTLAEFLNQYTQSKY